MANGPEHQHFLPRSYLKNFAVNEGKGKYFVEAKNLSNGQIINSISTRDICVQSNLYTIPNGEIEQRYILEKYYADNVDSSFPDIYKLLCNENVSSVSTDQKYKILYTVLSLYFRTPKFLNGISREDDAFIDAAIQNRSNDEYVRINWADGQKSKFKVGDTQQEKIKRREVNRIRFLKEHLEEWHQFVYQKKHGVIHVFSVEPTIPLITSDNPVHIGSLTNELDIFSPSNFIQLPIDSHRLMWISPYEGIDGRSSLNRISRQSRDETFAITSNSTVQKQAERWIFGYPGSVKQHIQDQQKYEQPEVGEPIVEHWKEKATELMELFELMKAHGPISRRVADKVKSMRKLDAFKNSKELDLIVIPLAKAGLLTV